MSAKRVLVVDDEPGIRNLFRDVLTRRGYEVELAEDGLTGIARAKDESVDIAFLDIRMPGLDGVDTLKRLKEVNPRLKVAIMTGSTASERVTEALRLGAFVCLCKPFGINDIVSTIEMLELDLDSAA